MTVLERIKKNAAIYPERYAIISKDENIEQKLKWKELDELSDRLATFLINTLKTTTPVIVYGHKNPYMIVCFLACVKAGRAYCPIDVNVPLS